MEEFILNNFFATTSSINLLISTIATGIAKQASNSACVSLDLETHILINLLLIIRSFFFLSLRTSSLNKIISQLLNVLSAIQLNFKKGLSSFNVVKNEGRP